MKKILLFLVFTVISQAAYSMRDSTYELCCPIEDSRVDIEGNNVLYLPESVLPAGMKGVVWFSLTVDDDGILREYEMLKIDVSDSSGNNAIKYFDLTNGNKTLPEDYPEYTRGLFKEVKAAFLKLKIIPLKVNPDHYIAKKVGVKFFINREIKRNNE